MLVTMLVTDPKLNKVWLPEAEEKAAAFCLQWELGTYSRVFKAAGVWREEWDRGPGTLPFSILFQIGIGSAPRLFLPLQ